MLTSSSLCVRIEVLPAARWLGLLSNEGIVVLVVSVVVLVLFAGALLGWMLVRTRRHTLTRKATQGAIEDESGDNR